MIQRKKKQRRRKRFEGKLGGCVPSLLTIRVNICQDRKASRWMMKSLFLHFNKQGSAWFYRVSQGCTEDLLQSVHMCLCRLVGTIPSSVRSDKARTSKAISSLLRALLLFLQSLNLPHITAELQIPPDKCHIWNNPRIHQKKESSPFSLKFSLSSQSSKYRLPLLFLPYSVESRVSTSEGFIPGN